MTTLGNVPGTCSYMVVEETINLCCTSGITYDIISRLVKAYGFTVIWHIYLSLPMTLMPVNNTERGRQKC